MLILMVVHANLDKVHALLIQHHSHVQKILLLPNVFGKILHAEMINVHMLQIPILLMPFAKPI